MAKSMQQSGDVSFLGKLRDYYELCKPRVIALMLLTALVGMQLAVPGLVPWRAGVFGILGIALSAASAAVLNHLVDYRIDALMARTEKRPLPAGRLSITQALYFAIMLGVIGIMILIIFVNLLTAILTLLTLFGYAGVYTLYLKRATPQNIVIGGAAGAAPPLLGWVAVTGHVSAQPLLLMLIIFVWTPPHFWALAIYREKDYARAKIPMLPVTHGVRYTKLSILLYTFLLVAVSILPFVISMSGYIYLLGALILNAGFVYFAFSLWRKDDLHLALQTFRYSILYLFGLFVFLLLDHYVH